MEGFDVSPDLLVKTTKHSQVKSHLKAKMLYLHITSRITKKTMIPQKQTTKRHKNSTLEDYPLPIYLDELSVKTLLERGRTESIVCYLTFSFRVELPQKESLARGMGPLQLDRFSDAWAFVSPVLFKSNVVAFPPSCSTRR